ncbi:MAG: DegT/DnrJ/EryC1/StrS family aminotransferase, partial [Bacillota bacterium]
SYNIDPQKTVAKIKELIARDEKPKAVIVVHLYGHPADIDPILDICEEYDIKVIEDATEALGSKYKEKKVGSLGDIGCFSFNGNKLITTGGGGMLVTDNKDYADYVKYLSTQAKDDPQNYIHNEVGYNYRLTNIQAAMGLAQLKHIEEFIAAKRNIAQQYNEAFSEVDGITINPEEDWAYNCCWLYTVLIDKNKYGIYSKELYKSLNEVGVGARPFWKPIHTMPMYEECEADIKVANQLWKQGINLPCSVGIKEEEIKTVIDKIMQFKED